MSHADILSSDVVYVRGVYSIFNLISDEILIFFIANLSSPPPWEVFHVFLDLNFVLYLLICLFVSYVLKYGTHIMIGLLLDIISLTVHMT